MRMIVKVNHRRGSRGHSIRYPVLASHSQEAEAWLYRLSRGGSLGRLGEELVARRYLAAATYAWLAEMADVVSLSADFAAA